MIFNISKKGPANRHAQKAKFFFKSSFLFFKRKFSDKKSVLAVAYLGGGGAGVGGMRGAWGADTLLSECLVPFFCSLFHYSVLKP